MIKGISLPWGIRLDDPERLWQDGYRFLWINADLKDNKSANPFLIHNLQQAKFARNFQVGLYVTLQFTGASPASQAVFLKDQLDDIKRRGLALDNNTAIWIVGSLPSKDKAIAILNAFGQELDKLRVNYSNILLNPATMSALNYVPYMLWLAQWDYKPNLVTYHPNYWQSGPYRPYPPGISDPLNTGTFPFLEHRIEASDYTNEPETETPAVPTSEDLPDYKYILQRLMALEYWARGIGYKE